MASVNSISGNNANRSYPGFFVNDGVWHVTVCYPRRIYRLVHWLSDEDLSIEKKSLTW